VVTLETHDTAEVTRPSSATPSRVAAVALAAAIVFVVLRLVVAADGDLSRFVVAGTLFTDPAEAPASLHVFDSDGYDGQFFWRLAADPAHLQADEHLGVRIDQPYRLQRIGYPLLAWVLSAGGTTALVPWALVAVNLAAMAALAWMGASMARDAGRSVWLGLVVAGVPGFAMALSRDLSDLLGAALFLGGLLAARRGRWWLAAGLWSYGVLTREQLVIPVAVFGLWRLGALVRRRSRVSAADAAWILPAVAFAGWQLVVLATSGRLPLTSATGNNLTVPLTGLAAGVGSWLSGLGDGPKGLGTGLVSLIELAALIALVAAALRAGAPGERAYERWMLVVLAAVALCLARVVWDPAADLRTLADLSVLAWAVLLFWGPRDRTVPLLVTVQGVALTGAVAIRLVSI
jgi:hypothetical protein